MNIIEFYNGISPYLFKYIFISQQCYVISQCTGLVHILFSSLLNINFSDFFGRFLKIVYIHIYGICRDNFTSSFPISKVFYFFSYLILLLRNPVNVEQKWWQIKKEKTFVLLWCWIMIFVDAFFSGRENFPPILYC